MYACLNSHIRMDYSRDSETARVLTLIAFDSGILRIREQQSVAFECEIQRAFRTNRLTSGVAPILSGCFPDKPRPTNIKVGSELNTPEEYRHPLTLGEYTGPMAGRRTCPPWLCPASIRSTPCRLAHERLSGVWLSSRRKMSSGTASNDG